MFLSFFIQHRLGETSPVLQRNVPKFVISTTTSFWVQRVTGSAHTYELQIQYKDTLSPYSWFSHFWNLTLAVTRASLVFGQNSSSRSRDDGPFNRDDAKRNHDTTTRKCKSDGWKNCARIKGQKRDQKGGGRFERGLKTYDTVHGSTRVARWMPNDISKGHLPLSICAFAEG